MSKPLAGTDVPDIYFELVRRFPLVPIRDDLHLERASVVLDELTSRDLDVGEEAYRDVLTDLVESYEGERIPEVEVSAAELLKELLRQRGITQGELAREVGIAQSTLSAIVNGARRPTLEHARKLGGYFKLKPAAFLAL